MPDAFTDLRNVLRRRHDWLKSKLADCKDDAQAQLLRSRRREIWEIWHDLLFEGSRRKPKPPEATP